MAKITDIPKDQNIINLPFEEAMPDNYLPYAVDVAKDRALPDIRDGLKPVHRRILYGAYLLKAYPDRPYFKSARIVGDILGKFHPHGDSSVYDAMVIMAQDFATREPLMDGHGNWGSMDGDSAAAMRYTEARLSKQAMQMLRDIEMDTVEFQNNYSDTEVEPVVLPSRFPNLLVNGTFGIAVGLATNIPPHNLGEVIDATCALIKNRKLDTDDLMKYIKGPDLPTGGILIGKDNLQKAYTTGEGKVTLRAKTEIEKLSNGRWGIVITEFPFRKNKAKLLQTISEMTGDKKHQKFLESITDIRDESDRQGIRAVIELKKTADEKQADLVLKYLLKKTDLQSNLSFNMVSINKGKPGTFGLKEMLEAYIEHQQEVVRRRSEKELANAKKRFHIVEGFIKAISIMDEVIKTIRASKNKADSINNLVEAFSFTVEQATAIVELMLYRLTGLEIEVFQKEHGKLKKTIEYLNKILGNEKELNKLIISELNQVKKEFDNPRRTQIVDDLEEAEIDTNELIVVEDSMVTLSKQGFIKKVALKSYNRSTADIASIELREDDEIISVFKTNTLDNIYIFTNLGNMYKFKSDKVPELKWKEKGVRFDELFRGSNQADDETVVGAFSLKELTETMVFKFITDRGNVKKTAAHNFDTNYTRIISLKLKDKEHLFGVIIEDGRNLIDNRNPAMIEKKSAENKLAELNALYDQEPNNLPIDEMEVETEFISDQSLELAEWETIPSFVSITTEKGLSFTVPDVEVEIKDKMVLPDQMVKIPENDKIISLHYEYDYEIRSFKLNADRKFNLFASDKLDKNTYKSLEGDSASELLVIVSNGNAYKLGGYLFENISGKLSLSDMLGIKRTENIVNVFVLEKSLVTHNLYLAVNNGLIKAMDTEFFNEFESGSIIKFKNDSDRVIGAEIFDNPEKHIILITEHGMALKFEAKHVPVQGRAATGVTGMSLKEGDKLSIMLTDEVSKFNIVTDKNNKKLVESSAIKSSSRARKGTSVYSPIMDEIIERIENK